MEWQYDAAAEGVWVRSDRHEALKKIDSVIFDVDGVLVEVKESFPKVSADAALFYLQAILGWRGQARPVLAEETVFLKRAGGFNSDWRLTQAIVYFALFKSVLHGTTDLDRIRSVEPGIETFMEQTARHGGGMDGVRKVVYEQLDEHGRQQLEKQFDPAAVDRICCEFYAGSDCPAIFGFEPEYRRGEQGYIWRETALLSRESLEGAPFHLGIYTGRTDGEIPPALQLCQVEDLFSREAVITGSSPYHKPDPGGLTAAARSLGSRCGLFVGDNVDDYQTVARYRQTEHEAEIPFLFAAILGGAPGKAGEQIFRSFGVDCIANNVNILMRFLREIHPVQS